MSRLIDADAVIEEMSEKHRPNFHEDLKAYHMWIMWYWALKEAPTIDAVEVVRCKDCKYIFFDDWYKCFSCANLYGLNEEVKPDDFCSHGERKESE